MLHSSLLLKLLIYHTGYVVLVGISTFLCLLLLFFIAFKNNVTHPLPTVKNKVTNIVISLNGVPIFDSNDATVTFPILTERRTLFVYKKSKTATHLQYMFTYFPCSFIKLFCQIKLCQAFVI